MYNFETIGNYDRSMGIQYLISFITIDTSLFSILKCFKYIYPFHNLYCMYLNKYLLNFIQTSSSRLLRKLQLTSHRLC